MERIIGLLHEGGYSCVVRNGERIRTFGRRGVADLHELLHREPELLEGASVADKVVGKAAAALMAAGGVRELYADTVSEGALELLRRAGIEVSFGRRVPHIVNRTRTDICPLERRCLAAREVAECLSAIDEFVAAGRASRPADAAAGRS
ncbi:MAG: DUF1893 domain-containing protein [Rikenellaceae bacterium]|nr:DUF1893 domain-containing protein [Rikenellaceae bacterium]